MITLATLYSVYRPRFERLLKVLWLEEPDILPLYEHFVDAEVIEAIVGEPLKFRLERRAHKERYVSLLVKFYRSMGYDYVPLELGLKFPRKNVICTEDTAPLSRGLRRWQNENRGVIESIEDFEGFPWPGPDEAVDYELLEILCRRMPSDMGVVSGVGGGVLEHVMWLMGARPFFLSIYRDRRLVEKMFGAIGRLIYDVDSRIAEYDGVGVLRMGDDMGYNAGTFIPPEMLRKYVFPWQKKCADLAHRHDKPFILHSCGNLERIMEDLIYFVGIDAKHSFEDSIMPVTEAKRKYGNEIAILGGVDVDKLSRYGPAEVGDYVRRVVKECAPGGGYALGSGNTITNYVRIENYLTMVRVRDKYGCYRRTWS